MTDEKKTETSPEPEKLPEEPPADEHEGFTLFGFPIPFFMLNIIEMFERLAYYGVRALVAVYIMQADEPGGLHFTAAQKGTIYAWWFVFQSVLPTFTGGFADRYGYKKTIAAAVTLNVVGYTMMAYMRDFWGFFIAVMVLEDLITEANRSGVHRSPGHLGLT